jgi:predicted RNA-binding protein with PIN domain
MDQMTGPPSTINQTRPRVLIVDGHSAIFQWPILRKLHARRTASARDELVRLLTGYQDATGIHVAVVFDGQGAKASAPEEPTTIQIFYSAAGQTADSIIERLAAKYAGEYDVSVATDDHLERSTVSSFGASPISTIQLWDELAAARSDLDERLRTLRQPRTKPR